MKLYIKLISRLARDMNDSVMNDWSFIYIEEKKLGSSRPWKIDFEQWNLEYWAEKRENA